MAKVKYTVSGICYPGTVLHPKRGKISLSMLNQKVLGELYAEADPVISKYVKMEEGNPPCEKEIDVKKTPAKKGKNIKPAPQPDK